MKKIIEKKHNRHGCSNDYTIQHLNGEQKCMHVIKARHVKRGKTCSLHAIRNTIFFLHNLIIKMNNFTSRNDGNCWAFRMIVHRCLFQSRQFTIECCRQVFNNLRSFDSHTVKCDWESESHCIFTLPRLPFSSTTLISMHTYGEIVKVCIELSVHLVFLMWYLS